MLSNPTPDTVTLPRFARIDQVATALDVTARHVMKLIDAGELRAIDVAMIGSERMARRVCIRSVHQLLKRRAIQPTNAASIALEIEHERKSE